MVINLKKSIILNLPKRIHFAGLLADSAEAKMVEDYFKYSYVGEASRQLGKTIYIKQNNFDKLGNAIKRLFK